LSQVEKEPSQEESDEANPEKEESEDTEAKETEPVVYEFEAPEGRALEPKTSEELKALLAKHEAKPEIAQDLVDMMFTLEERNVEVQKQAEDAQIKEWQTEIKSDPYHAKTLLEAKKAVDKLAEPALKELLDGSLGDFPPMVKFLAGVGKMLGEGTFVEGEHAISEQNTLKSLYSNSPNLKFD
jgi:hypothetical protein